MCLPVPGYRGHTESLTGDDSVNNLFPHNLHNLFSGCANIRIRRRVVAIRRVSGGKTGTCQAPRRRSSSLQTLSLPSRSPREV